MPNTATITLGGKEIELRASNWASQVYAETFSGQDRGLYNGSLQHDMSQVVADCFTFNDDGSFNIAFSNIPFQIWGMVWALAYAAGSTKAGYAQWMKSKRNEVWDIYDQADACGVVVSLIEEAFFRRDAQQDGKESAEG